MKAIIDTNVLSEARRPGGHPGVKRYLMQADEDDLFISVITLGELSHGIAKLEPSARQAELERWLAATERLFDSRLLPITRDVAVRWGRLTVQCARRGYAIGQSDALIAATAVEHDLAVLTRNVRHFEPTGVTVIDPSQAAG